MRPTESLERGGFALARTGTANLRRQTTQLQIIDAVRAMLGEGQSFSELSVGRIAQRAGISRATFYLHFEDKRQLLGVLAQQELTEWEAISEPFLANPEAGRAEIELAVRGVVELWVRHRGVLSALIELAEYDDVARDAWRGTIRAVGTSIAQYSRERDSQVPDADVGGEMIAWTGERVLHQMLDNADGERREAVIESLTELLWRSLEPRA